MSVFSPEWHIKAVNLARETKRIELLPQVAATIYGGLIARGKHASMTSELMDESIRDAEELLLKLYPIMPDADNRKV